MKLNNKGFALTSIIYMLIVLFLMILLLILANLATRKVVLDKIKNDVKENLNQGGLLAQNTYTVTFDPTIGQINQKTKQVKYNEPYGELPTPTREGYKFIGWTSKNLAPEINNQNYNLYNYENRTTTEFREENGTNYIRINGNTSDTNIDTMWAIHSTQKMKLNQGEYTLSFDVRTQNALATQSIKKIIVEGSNTIGRTGIYVNQSVPYVKTNVLSNIENDYIFDNDGQWHHFTSKVTIPYYTNDALITIGNDAPNLYGPNSYIDIKNIQLEPGNTATAYEPYFGNITSDTIVTRGENHTLYAMWEKKESTLITGPEFNAKIKQLAGNNGATPDTDDTNITSVQRANSLPNFELTNNNIVSTNDSNTPTYAWFDNSTIYYYTEALSLYTNADASHMFKRLKNLTSLNVSTFDTTKTTNMQMMFSILPKIETIDVSNFDTSNVTSMYAMFNSFDTNNGSYQSSLKNISFGNKFNTSKVTNMRSMFAYCSKLESLDLSTFDTKNVTTMYHMLTCTSRLTSLDLSTFDMSSVTDISDIINPMGSLQELKTPKVYPSNASLTFTLPKTMYDTSNNAYTTLGSGSPTETLLKDTQTN